MTKKVFLIGEMCLFLLLSFVCYAWAIDFKYDKLFELEEILEGNAKNEANKFIGSLNNPGKIKFISLKYWVLMDCEFGVRLKTTVTLIMAENGENRYSATFRIAKPIGDGVWSRFAMWIKGNDTEDFKEMVKGLKVKIVEEFFFENQFMTSGFEEKIEEIIYPGQTAIRVIFDYPRHLILFWPDKNKSFFKFMAYKKQVGPLTGFFNYLIFEKNNPMVKMHIVNALKRATTIEGGETEVEYQFSSEEADIFHCQDKGFNTISFVGHNFLDIIYGKIRYKLVQCDFNETKIPYFIMLDGIISKKKKQEMLKKLGERKIELVDGDFNVDEILSAKDVRIFLAEVIVKKR